MTAGPPLARQAASGRAGVLALTLLDGHDTVSFDDVTHLIASDATGQFGLLPDHADFITVLEPGLFRFRRVAAPAWAYAAGLGGLLACRRSRSGTTVQIVSGRFLFSDEPETLQARLDALLAREHALRLSTRESQTQLELALVKRLQQLSQSRP